MLFHFDMGVAVITKQKVVQNIINKIIHDQYFQYLPHVVKNKILFKETYMYIA